MQEWNHERWSSRQDKKWKDNKFSTVYSLCTRGCNCSPLPRFSSSIDVLLLRPSPLEMMTTIGWILRPGADTPSFYRKKKITTTMANQTDKYTFPVSFILLYSRYLPIFCALGVTRSSPDRKLTEKTNKNILSSAHTTCILCESIDNTHREEERIKILNKNRDKMRSLIVKRFIPLSAPSIATPFIAFHSTSPFNSITISCSPITHAYPFQVWQNPAFGKDDKTIRQNHLK